MITKSIPAAFLGLFVSSLAVAASGACGPDRTIDAAESAESEFKSLCDAAALNATACYAGDWEGEAEEGYAAKISSLYCQAALVRYDYAYSTDCLSAAEDYFACIAESNCDEIESEDACEPDLDDMAAACEVKDHGFEAPRQPHSHSYDTNAAAGPASNTKHFAL